jgi:hypothetical protein
MVIFPKEKNRSLKRGLSLPFPLSLGQPEGRRRNCCQDGDAPEGTWCFQNPIIASRFEPPRRIGPIDSGRSLYQLDRPFARSEPGEAEKLENPPDPWIRCFIPRRISEYTRHPVIQSGPKHMIKLSKILEPPCSHGVSAPSAR